MRTKYRCWKQAVATRRHDGFTLVEVLVTLVVISVGLLGVAALQAVSVHNNHAAYLRGQASALADDIIDRMRSNRNEALTYDVAMGAAPGATDQALTDITEWRTQLRALLPQYNSAGAATAADGSIDVTQIGASQRFTVVVTIQWGEMGTDNPMSFTTTTEI